MCAGCCAALARLVFTSRRCTCARPPKRHREVIAKALAAADVAAKDAVGACGAVARGAGQKMTLSKRRASARCGSSKPWSMQSLSCSRPRRCIGSYVVSMAKDADDILSVLLLARWAGYIQAGATAGSPSMSRRCSNRSTHWRPRARSCRAFSTTRSIAPTWRRAAIARLLRSATPTAKRSRASRHPAGCGARPRWRCSRCAPQRASGWSSFTVAPPRLAVASRTEAIVRSLPSGCSGGAIARQVEQAVSRSMIGMGLVQLPIALRTFERGLNTLALTHSRRLGTENVEPAGRGTGNSCARRARITGPVVHDDPGFLNFFRLVTPVDVIERTARSGHDHVSATHWRRCHAGGAVDVRRVSQLEHVAGWFGAGHGLKALTDQLGSAILEDRPQLALFQGLVDDDALRCGWRAQTWASRGTLRGAGRKGHGRVLRRHAPVPSRPRCCTGKVATTARFGANAAALDLAAQSLRSIRST